MGDLGHCGVVRTRADVEEAPLAPEPETGKLEASGQFSCTGTRVSPEPESRGRRARGAFFRIP